MPLWLDSLNPRVFDSKYQQPAAAVASVLSSASRCFHWPKNALQPTMARQVHQKRTPDFHDKYENAILTSGATFCVATWTYSDWKGEGETQREAMM